MTIENFLIVGENVHCTRIYKVDGKFVKPDADGDYSVCFKKDRRDASLPVPALFRESADWESGKVRHCAVAIWQGIYGEEDARATGTDYIQAQAKRQEQAGAAYLDINVDEFSTDMEERVKAMKWTAETVQSVTSLPLSIDSSNIDILRAGLEACDPSRGRPMVNSVSLERADAVAVAAEFNAVVIASAAGEKGLPSTTEERLGNMGALMAKLEAAGFDRPAIHVDPLVFPISTDSQNGIRFLDTVAAARAKYGAEIHIVAGLSNVSFGMPNRKLINQVYAWLAVEAGADGGIVDPLQLNKDALNALDPDSEAFKLARALLVGEDDFGMEYITASRDGRI